MKQTEIFSIFGQIEAAAAEHMIAREGCKRIAPELIPPSAAFNESGAAALFALVVPAAKVRRFNALCDNLRA